MVVVYRTSDFPVLPPPSPWWENVEFGKLMPEKFGYLEGNLKMPNLVALYIKICNKQQSLG